MENLDRRVRKAEKKHGGKNLHALQTEAVRMSDFLMKKKEDLTVRLRSRIVRTSIAVSIRSHFISTGLATSSCRW